MYSKIMLLLFVNYNLTSPPTDNQIQIICSSNGKEKIIPQLYLPKESNTFPDEYFTVLNSQIMIYTKHFTVFAIKFDKEWVDEYNKLNADNQIEEFYKKVLACNKREVELVADAYYQYINDIVTTWIYIRDTNIEETQRYSKEVFSQSDIVQKETMNLKEKIISQVEEKGFKQLFINERISGLPIILRKESKLGCVMVLSSQRWKEVKSMEV